MMRLFLVYVFSVFTTASYADYVSCTYSEPNYKKVSILNTGYYEFKNKEFKFITDDKENGALGLLETSNGAQVVLFTGYPDVFAPLKEEEVHNLVLYVGIVGKNGVDKVGTVQFDTSGFITGDFDVAVKLKNKKYIKKLSGNSKNEVSLVCKFHLSRKLNI